VTIDERRALHSERSTSAGSAKDEVCSRLQSIVALVASERDQLGEQVQMLARLTLRLEGAATGR
jgi:hypothetical protein